MHQRSEYNRLLESQEKLTAQLDILLNENTSLKNDLQNSILKNEELNKLNYEMNQKLQGSFIF